MMKMTSISWLLISFVALLTVAGLPMHSTAFQMAPLAKTHNSSTLATSSALNAATSLFPEFSYPSTEIAGKAAANVQLCTYEHDGYTLKYRYKPAAPGYEKEAPLLLIHPVGIGMSSWFWDELMEQWTDGGAIYAPDLIGCGIDNGSSAWKPEEKGMFFPLSWVRGCEALMQQFILKNQNQNNPFIKNLPFAASSEKVTVVTQGGLAPVGVMLASRNPDTVGKLVMTSPPTWKDMTTAVPEKELESNYNFLKSPLGSLAFGALESKGAIRFFSDVFLFEGKCDDKWLDRCMEECRYQEARPPIQAFNAGLMQHRSYIEELTSLPQPTVIVQGQDDVNRIPQRVDYESNMKECTLVTLPNGKNVLPWECPASFANVLKVKK
jgi:pimeloyl-ACP methyl ester carboxylesterase